jgi:hypothetical protein
MPVIVEKVGIDQVLNSGADMIFYGARTCWWTHDNRHLYKTDRDVPCDPRGGVLFQTDDVQGFLKTAEENIDRYGKHGMRAFMAAHHENCQVSESDDRPTCMETWQEYNDALDAMLLTKGEKP